MNQTKQDGITVIHVLTALEGELSGMKIEHRKMLWEAARAWEGAQWMIVRQKVAALRKAGVLLRQQGSIHNRRLSVLIEAMNRIYDEAKRYTPFD